MAQNEQVRRFLALLNRDQAELDQSEKRELGELACHPDVKELFGDRAAMALTAVEPLPAETPPAAPSRELRRQAPVPPVIIRASDNGLLVAAATLTAGYWAATAARPNAPAFSRDDYMDTFRATLRDLTDGGNDGRERSDGAPGRTVARRDEGRADDDAG